MMHYSVRRILAAFSLAGAALFVHPANADLVSVEFSRAEADGNVSCPSKFGETQTLGPAFLHVWNNSCWSCPKGFGRTVDPNVAGGAACHRGAYKQHSRATRHARATGLLGTDCPRDSGQFWHAGDGHCYSCPKGYSRTVFGIGSNTACEKTVPAAYASGTERGLPGCPEGAFQHFLGDSCFRCPVGYSRSATPSFDGKLDELGSACVKVQIGGGGELTDKHRTELARVQAKHSDLISSAATVAANLKDHTAEIQAAARERRPLPASVIKKSELDQLAVEADKAGFQAITIGVAGDISLGTGVTFSAGLAHGVQDWTGVWTYSSNAWSVCCSIGGDVAPEIGLWLAPPSRIAGDAHGVTVGAAYKAGLAASFWWDYCPDVGGKACIFHPFLGFSVMPQLGMSAEAEYIRGTTRASMVRTGSE